MTPVDYLSISAFCIHGSLLDADGIAWDCASCREERISSGKTFLHTYSPGTDDPKPFIALPTFKGFEQPPDVYPSPAITVRAMFTIYAYQFIYRVETDIIGADEADLLARMRDLYPQIVADFLRKARGEAS